MNPKPTMDSMVHLWKGLTLEERGVMLDPRMQPRLKRLLARAVHRIQANTFAKPISDEEAVHQLVKLKGMMRSEALHLVATWRRLAAELGYTGPIAWQVREGFTLKGYGPEAGPCYENWAYLQDWRLQNDAPTIASIVFWIPCFLTESTWKTVPDQRLLLGQVRTRLILPPDHLKDFGSAAFLTALIQAYLQWKGVRVPLNGMAARTDTLHADGNRLSLRWGEGRLYCDCWRDGNADGGFGVFALGVEALGHPDA